MKAGLEIEVDVIVSVITACKVAPKEKKNRVRILNIDLHMGNIVRRG